MTENILFLLYLFFISCFRTLAVILVSDFLDIFLVVAFWYATLKIMSAMKRAGAKRPPTLHVTPVLFVQQNS